MYDNSNSIQSVKTGTVRLNEIPVPYGCIQKHALKLVGLHTDTHVIDEHSCDLGLDVSRAQIVFFQKSPFTLSTLITYLS